MKIIHRLAVLLAMFSASAFAQSAPSLTVAWDAYPPSLVTQYAITGFDVQRKAEACAATTLAFTTVATVPGATNLSYKDLSVVPGKTYGFKIRGNAPVTAANPQGNSDYSVCVDKTVTLPGLPPPSNPVISLITALIDALEKFKTALLTPAPTP